MRGLTFTNSLLEQVEGVEQVRRVLGPGVAPEEDSRRQDQDPESTGQPMGSCAFVDENTYIELMTTASPSRLMTMSTMPWYR